ncbi:hypothetical protein MMC17_004585 [Xylographa soralifera]|nr:hypothetical protein [Xylographa soralifera]
MTAVASPPSFQSLPRLGWNSDNSAQGGLNSMSADDVTRMFMPRKGLEKTGSSSSLSSASSVSSSTSDSTATTNNSQGHPTIQKLDLKAQVEREGWGYRKKPARGLWPSSKADPVSGISNARPQSLPTSLSGTSAASAMSAIHQPAPILASQNMVQSSQQVNGNRPVSGQGGSESAAVLVLLPINGTFERKQIAVPLFPEILRIGRQTNAKTVPTPVNGYFDSKVLSRQHAEVWADRSGKIWIRDVKSSNGTFVNGVRLSPENRDSEPHELREHDTLELGIDIVSEDQKSIVHHKVSAKVEHAGIPSSNSGVLDLNFGDIDPGSGNGLMGPTYPQHMVQMRGRNGSQGSVMSNGRVSGPPMMNGNINGLGAQRQMNAWLSPVTIEQVVKRLTTELKQAKQQSQDLNRTGDFFHALLAHEPGQELPKSPPGIFPSEPPKNDVPIQSKGDPMSPFSQPPAPPPQQPLPEKPDVTRSNITDSNIQLPLKRMESERTHTSVASSPIRSEPTSSQILSLVEALTSAKRQIDHQGNSIKHLEDLLRQERKARETAEERARRLLGRSKGNDNAEEGNVEEDAFDPPSEDTISVIGIQPNGYEADDEGRQFGKRSPKSKSSPASPAGAALGDLQRDTQEIDTSTTRLQERLDLMVREMHEMKQHMEDYKRRAEGAEEERNSLAEMIKKIRKGDVGVKAVEFVSDTRKNSETSTQTEVGSHANGHDEHPRAPNGALVSKSFSNLNNAPIRSMKDVQELQDALKTALEASSDRNGRFMQSAPYASMLGVVLIGVGIMTYLNGWQKLER